MHYVLDKIVLCLEKNIVAFSLFICTDVDNITI